MKKLFSLVCTCLLAMSMQAAETDKYDALYENLPFQMEKVTRPQFPANEVNLKDFGAVGDGSTLCTEAFSKAIEALSQKGGGKLIVPQGVWFTGPITLKSNINLHIEKGGIILFSPDDALYPFVKTSFEGLDTRRCQSPISGNGLTNVAITGQGAIDGNGEYWRPLKKQKVTDAQWKAITSRGARRSSLQMQHVQKGDSSRGCQKKFLCLPKLQWLFSCPCTGAYCANCR